METWRPFYRTSPVKSGFFWQLPELSLNIIITGNHSCKDLIKTVFSDWPPLTHMGDCFSLSTTPAPRLCLCLRSQRWVRETIIPALSQRTLLLEATHEHLNIKHQEKRWFLFTCIEFLESHFIVQNTSFILLFQSIFWNVKLIDL